MFRNNFFLFLFLFFSLVFAQEQNWQIAAQEFELIDVPDHVSFFSTAVPTLILAQISMNSNRIISSDEIYLKEKQRLEELYISALRERVKLKNELNMMYFFEGTKKERTNKIKVQEKKIQQKELDLNIIKKKIDKNEKSKASEKPKEVTISLWNNGSSLYKIKQDKTTKASLRADGISFLISGSLEDLNGYVLAHITCISSIPGVETIEIEKAAAYDEIDLLVERIQSSLFSVIVNKKIISMELTCIPSDALVFIDSELIASDHIFFIAEGKHVIQAQASGYESALWEGIIAGNEEFSILIQLKPKKTQKIAFTFDSQTNLYFDGMWYGGLQIPVSLTHFPSLGYLEQNKVKTWFVINENVFNSESQSLFQVHTNKIPVQQKIEKQRSVLYWSLGAFYFSLPIAMFFYGKSEVMAKAYLDDRLPQTDKNYKTIINFMNASSISQGISVVLGINYFFQLGRYFWMAEKVLPQTIGDL